MTLEEHDVVKPGQGDAGLGMYEHMSALEPIQVMYLGNVIEMSLMGVWRKEHGSEIIRAPALNGLIYMESGLRSPRPASDIVVSRFTLFRSRRCW